MNKEGEHSVYFKILETRELKGIEKGTPLWKLKLSAEEYDSLKDSLKIHSENLDKYGIEAALCYAEWWRRDFLGNIPSKEEVAKGIGLDSKYGDALFEAAKTALKKKGYTFIHSTRKEYFRTLLNQGGLPINYIKNNNGNYTRFLKELVNELSTINYDWNELDISIVKELNCISYLGKSFRNDNIYDISLQIAHAIIKENDNLLPYDDTEESLSELTKSLKDEYKNIKDKKKTRPFSLNWELNILPQGNAQLFVKINQGKNIISSSIPNLDCENCCEFNVIVAGTLVGKYIQKELKNNDGKIEAIYTRTNIDQRENIQWKGESVVEVKIICDNGERLFLTIPGCYPPNYEYPQVFQMVDENIYIMGETGNTENNIAIYTQEWKGDNSRPIKINDLDLYCEDFQNSLNLTNLNSGEEISLENKFTPYKAEFEGNYIQWVEKSNYKLLAEVPNIKIYDKDGNRVNTKNKLTYRTKEDVGYTDWNKLSSSSKLPTGLIDIKVEFPDKNSAIERFFFIGKMCFNSRNEDVDSTELICSCDSKMHVEMADMENIQIEKIESNKWRVSKEKNTTKCPCLCEFIIYIANNHKLRLSIAIPFKGIKITDVYGNAIKNDDVISFNNLEHYNIVSHNQPKREIEVSYKPSEDKQYSEKIRKIKENIRAGIVSLADYRSRMIRMFNLYGDNISDRKSSVILKIYGSEIQVRKFTLKSTYNEGKIYIHNGQLQSDYSNFKYEGDIYALPVGDDIEDEDFHPIELEHESENVFIFPSDFSFDEIIVFSNSYAKEKIIPKYYIKGKNDLTKEERSLIASKNISDWEDVLKKEDFTNGKHWKRVCKAFYICSKYNLPFTTYNGIKILAKDSKLLVNFIIAMFCNDYKQVLVQDIERFEQELAIALHWIPFNIWEECVSQLFNNPSLTTNLLKDLLHLHVFMKDIFSATLSAEIVGEFVEFINGNPKKELKRAFSHEEIRKYKEKIRGHSDINNDLPMIDIELHRRYYSEGEMPKYYETMIKSAICAAESVCNIENHTNLFSLEENERARIINFYRNYFKPTYSEIFMKSIKIIKSN